MQLRAFALALFVLGVSVAGTFIFLGGDWQSDRGRVAVTIYSAIPGFVGLLIKALMAPRQGNPSAPAVLGIRVAFGWMLVAWATAAVLALAMAIEFDAQSHRGWWLSGSQQRFVRGLAVGPTLMALFALGQELGFRGFLLGTLQEQGRLAPVKMIGLTTGAWILWTLPVLVGLAESFTQALWLLLWTAIAGWFLAELRLHSRSVLPTATFWGTYTALGQALPESATSGPEVPALMLLVAVAFHFAARRFRTWWLFRSAP